MHEAENVYAVLHNHKRSCRVVENPLLLPERYCDCGVLGSSYGVSVFSCHNIVTDDGNQHYAERGAQETVTVDFAEMALGTTASPSPSVLSDAGDLTLVTGSNLSIDGTYPQTDDSDADNPGTTGATVTTWRRTYTTGQANDTDITEVMIGAASTTWGSGSDPVLLHGAFVASFDKTTADTLKVYVNHTFIGQA